METLRSVATIGESLTRDTLSSTYVMEANTWNTHDIRCNAQKNANFQSPSIMP